MSEIDDLLRKFCPNGLEFKPLSELGAFYGGLSGKTKTDFTGGNARYITYMNVYSNISVNPSGGNFVKIAENERQNKVEIGDVLFTGSSESKEECGMSSVMTEVSNEEIYLNSFCFGLRILDRNLFLPGFLKYLFRSDKIREQIVKTSSGVTRYNVSKKRFEKIFIPLPPLPIQHEIVKILDSFTALEAELEARSAQYEYYRNKLLAFEGEDVEWKSLGEVSKCYAGATPRTGVKEYWENGTIPWMSSGEVN